MRKIHRNFAAIHQEAARPQDHRSEEPVRNINMETVRLAIVPKTMAYETQTSVIRMSMALQFGVSLPVVIPRGRDKAARTMIDLPAPEREGPPADRQRAERDRYAEHPVMTWRKGNQPKAKITTLVCRARRKPKSGHSQN